MRLKYKNCFLQFVLICLFEQYNQSVKVSNYFDFYHCYGNKNGHQNRLKIGNWPFWSKFERFDRKINIEHKQIPKSYFNRRCELPRHIKRIFLVFSCADI